MSGGELNEGLLASLGQLLTSSANNLGELLKLMPSVGRMSRSAMASSDGRVVKRRRLSHQQSSSLTDMLASTAAQSAAVHVTDHHPVPALSPCFTGLYLIICSHSSWRNVVHLFNIAFN